MHKTPIGLTLAACLLLSTLFAFKSALADAPPATVSVAPQTTLIVLQHTVPSDILSTLHWERTELLPTGVSSVTARPSDNALVVIATPAGLAKVREIVAILDIAPRQVQIKSALATTTDAQLKASGVDFAQVPVNETSPSATPSSDYIQYGAGKSVAALLASLTKSGSILYQPIITTTNNTAASTNLSTMFPEKKLEESRFQVTPRLNSDNSITLALDISLAKNVVAEAIAPIELKALLTVKNGETRVIGKKTASGNTLLLFVTPTIVPQK